MAEIRLSVNAITWIVTGILFGKNADTRPVLSLALLAWVLYIIFVYCITDSNPFLLDFGSSAW